MRENREIYLDNNATTQVMPLAAQAAREVMEQLYGNPSSNHVTGLRARRILENARAEVLDLLGADSGRIIFTSGATEAIETAVFSRLCELKKNAPEPTGDGKPRVLLYGATEHKAVPQALAHWCEILGTGHEVLAIPVDEQGRLDLDFMSDQLPRVDMLCTMAVNNETGVIHDLPAINAILHRTHPQCAWLVDCVQAVGKMSLKSLDLSMTYASFSGHKLYAPKGIGALFVSEGATLAPLLAGGGQEGGARGGTENLPGVAAFAAVLRNLKDPAAQQFKSHQVLQEYRDRLRASLSAAFPGIVYNTPFDKAVPTTINFAVEGFSSKELMDLFDAADIRVSSGSACGSAIQGSYVLEAMGLPAWRSNGAIRLSFGPTSTDDQIAAACSRIREAGRALRTACLATSADAASSPPPPIHGLVQLKSGSDCSWVLVDEDSKRCIVVDPFASLVDRILAFVRCQDLRVTAVLDTHQHVDHESPRPQLVEALGERMLQDDAHADVLGWPDRTDETVELGDATTAPCIRVSDTLVMARTPLPGHTADGQVLLVGPSREGRLPPETVRYVFSGDMILIGGIGRTDFHSSAHEEMLSSLRRLPKLCSADSIICPTHDYHSGFVTTLGSERRGNPMLARILDEVVVLSLEEYVAEKRLLDAQITDETNCELVCGHIPPPTDERTTLHLTAEQLTEFLAADSDRTVIDVREAHEFCFKQNWNAIGLDQPPRNVPLGRLADFFAELLIDKHDLAQQQIVFVCRSGNRSSRAAEVAARLGVRNAVNLAGGLALGMEGTQAYDPDLEYAI